MYGHQACAPGLTPFPVAGVFQFGPETPLGTDPAFVRLQTFVEGSALFGADCAALDAEHPGEPDLLVIPYATDVEIMGVARWAERRRHKGHPLPAVVAVLHRPDDGLWTWDAEKGRLGGDLSYWCYAVHRLVSAVGPDRHALVTTTGALADALHGRLPGRIVAGCAPMAYPWPQVAGADGPPLYEAAFLGQMRPEKGSRILAEILRLRLEAAPGARFAVQIDCPGAPGDWMPGYEALRDDPRIDWQHGAIDEARFAGILSRSACVLLPAEPDRYRFRISGVFCDALAAGRPAIVPRGSWMATMLARGHGAGMAVGRQAPASYARALAVLQASREEAALKAQAAAAAWRSEQNIGRLVDIALGALAPA